MRFAAPSLSDLRLRRLHRWALLWLKWIAAFLDAAEAFAPLSKMARAIAGDWIGYYERVIWNIVVLRAAPLLTPTRPGRGEPKSKRMGLDRAIRGARLRRMLASRGEPRQRIAALSRLNIDALVAALLRRTPRGLTRRRAIRARPGPAPRIGAPASLLPARVLDSS